MFSRVLKWCHVPRRTHLLMINGLLQYMYNCYPREWNIIAWPRWWQSFGVKVALHIFQQRIILWSVDTWYTINVHYKWYKINRILGNICAHVGGFGLGEPAEDGVMNAMTLSSRHEIRNSAEHATSRSWRLPTILYIINMWNVGYINNMSQLSKLETLVQQNSTISNYVLYCWSLYNIHVQILFL